MFIYQLLALSEKSSANVHEIFELKNFVKQNKKKHKYFLFVALKK